MIVAIKAIGRSLAFGKALELCAIHQENVGPTVVVIVEDGNAVAGSLDDVFLGVDPAKDVLRREAGFLSDSVKFATGAAETAADFVCCADEGIPANTHPIANAHAITARKEEEI